VVERATAHHPAVVGTVQPLPQVEGCVEHPAGEDEATGTGEGDFVQQDGKRKIVLVTDTAN